MKKVMTEAISLVRFSCSVFRVFIITVNNEKGKKMIEGSTSACLLLATALHSR